MESAHPYYSGQAAEQGPELREGRRPLALAITPVQEEDGPEQAVRVQVQLELLATSRENHN
jgi:hypothetical protein